MFAGNALISSVSKYGANTTILEHSGSYGKRSSLSSEDPLKQSGPSMYAEMEVVRKHSNVCIGFGIATNKLPTQSYPGWEPGSIGVHSDDGSVHTGGVSSLPFCPVFGDAGDVIGLGLYCNSINSNGHTNGSSGDNSETASLFFTLNGVFLGFVSTSVSVSSYLAIAFDGPATVSVSCSPPFKYGISNLEQDIAVTSSTSHFAATNIDTEQSFNQFISQPGYRLVEFYGPASSESVARMYRSRLAVGHVDVTRLSQVASRFLGTHAIAPGRFSGHENRLFSNGEMVESRVPSDTPQLASYLKQMFSQSVVSLVTSSDFVTCLQEGSVVVMAYFGLSPDEKQQAESAMKVFEQTAQQFVHDVVEQKTMFAVTFRRRVEFATIDSIDIASSLGIQSSPTVLLVKDSGREIEVFTNSNSDSNFDGLLDWVNHNTKTWLCTLNSASIRRIPQEPNRFVCFLFMSDLSAPSTITLIKSLRELAATPEFRDSFNFFICDESNEACLDVRKRYDIRSKEDSVGVLQNGKVKYRPTSASPLTRDFIANYCRTFLTTTTNVPFLRSGTIATTLTAIENLEGGKVWDIVTTQFNDICVSGTNRLVDCVVLFYAKSAPKSTEASQQSMNQVANLMATQKSLVFFQVDVDENDPPIETGVESVPSVVLVTWPEQSATPSPAFIQLTQRKTFENIRDFIISKSRYGESARTLLANTTASSE